MKKLNRKGLTLVELMAVVAVLAVIAVIVTPNVLGSINKSRDRLYQTQIDNILSAAKNWAADELARKHCLICEPDSSISGNTMTEETCNSFGGEGCKETTTANKYIEVELGTLYDGYIKEALTNPKTDEPFKDCVRVRITKLATGGDYNYTVRDLSC